MLSDNVSFFALIEIRYAPVGDENSCDNAEGGLDIIEIRYAPVGDENYKLLTFIAVCVIEIRYAPVGDENSDFARTWHGVSY